MRQNKTKTNKKLISVLIAVIAIVIAVVITTRQNEPTIQSSDTTLDSQVAATTSTDEVKQTTEDDVLTETVKEVEPELIEEAKETTTAMPKEETETKKEPVTKKSTSVRNQEITTKVVETITKSSTKPQFDYVGTITTYDGRVLYKVYDKTDGEYYYCDEDGIGKYTEEGALYLVRPSKQEIFANPISKVTVEGVTWYKYQTGNGKYRYLASDGRDTSGIKISILTNGKDSITVSGVTFYKTYSSDGQYKYCDSKGNCLLYDGSYCIKCGESTEVCHRTMSGYYCVICKENIPGLTCHPKSHHDASKEG